jgi:hypothetical protein
VNIEHALIGTSSLTTRHVCALPGMMLVVTQDDWQPFQNGETRGQPGSESGTVIVDDEHPSGARICLERDGRAPFAITCGVYGWMVHTRFFIEHDAANAAVRAMKVDLAALAANPSREGCGEFVERYP